MEFVLKNADLGRNAVMVKYAVSMDADTHALIEVVVGISSNG